MIFYRSLLLSTIVLNDNKPNKSEDHTSTFIYYLLFVKNEFHLYLEKTGLAKTGVAGPFPPVLVLLVGIAL